MREQEDIDPAFSWVVIVFAGLLACSFVVKQPVVIQAASSTSAFLEANSPAVVVSICRSYYNGTEYVVDNLFIPGALLIRDALRAALRPLFVYLLFPLFDHVLLPYVAVPLGHLTNVAIYLIYRMCLLLRFSLFWILEVWVQLANVL